MKTRKLFLGLAAMIAASTSFTSCSNEDELGARPSDGRTPITLTSNIATRTVNTELQETEIANGVQVGVFVAPTQAGELIADNAQITSDGNGGLAGPIGNYPTEEGATVGIYAYAPYNSAWTGKLNEAQTFTVKTDQTADADYLASDLLYGTPQDNAVAASENAVPVQFKHKLTKINLAFDTDEYEGDLAGAKVSLVNVYTQTTINLSDGTLGTSAQQADITVAEVSGDASSFKASAIIVPQDIAADADFVRVELADGTIVTAKLKDVVAFETAKKYTYTVKFNGSGDQVEISVSLSTVLDNWEDGNEDLTGGVTETEAYQVGDYMLSDGTFVQNGKLTDDQKSHVVAIVFSKEVSETDAEAGYNAYAMGLERKKGKMGFETLIGEDVGTFEGAFNDLDGRTKTAALIASTDYTNLDASTKPTSMLGLVENYSDTYAIAENVSSDWFLPSFGQLMQIMNNIGGAGITAATEVESDYVTSLMWQNNDCEPIEKLGQAIMAVTGKQQFPAGSVSLATSTENGKYLWQVVTKDKTDGEVKSFDYWGFGRGMGRGNNGDPSILPCVAVKLPAAVASATE